MPTGEFKPLLDREFAKASAQPITQLATPLLQELTNEGLRIFRRCESETARTGKENEDVAAMVLYRHLIEMVDAIEVLVSNSCGTGAIPILRSEFEGTLSLLYLLSDDTKYVDRSLSWLVVHIHMSIRARQVLEPGTDKGREYIGLYEKEFGRIIRSDSNSELADEIRQLEKSLETPQLAPVEAEYQRTRKVLRLSPEWFSLLEGPKNRAKLAENLGMGALYRLLYGDWSTLSHGNELRRYLSNESGGLAFDAVRRPDELQLITQLSALLLLNASRAMIEKFRKGEDLSSWYIREVKPLFDRLSSLKVTFTALRE